MSKLSLSIASCLLVLGIGGCAATFPEAASGSAAAAGQPAASSADNKTVDVGIDNFSFSPPTLTIVAGTKVRWTNHDDVPHTATANDKTFASKAMDTDETFSFQFDRPGTYPYFCAVHPHMTATVIVKPAPAKMKEIERYE